MNTDNGSQMETFVDDIDASGKLSYDNGIHAEHTLTERYLSCLGFEWSRIDEAYMRKYIEWFRHKRYI